MSRLHLRQQDQQALCDLISQYVPDVSVWVYGSRINGRSHDGSDLDVVLRSGDLSVIDFERMQALRDAICESNIPILIDIRDWAVLPESFHQEILKAYIELETC